MFDYFPLISQALRPALVSVREMCYRISDMGLCNVEKGKTYTLSEFRAAQFRQLREVLVVFPSISIS